ncbi:MAG: hypothetical protein RL177_85 [Bacteroidota bacterium]
MRRFLLTAVAVLLPGIASAQITRVSYGNDFLSTGGGARALGMGGAFTGIADDATGAFWNPAGLTRITRTQAGFMHSQRFGGSVNYDYASIAHPLDGSGAVVGLSLFRQGVDGIKNTLNAWDRERDRPVADPTDQITEFSASDVALMLSYAAPLSESLSWGTNVKLVYGRLGPFAQAWGYSLDAGVLYTRGSFRAGITAVDLTTLLKFWSVNEERLEPLRDYFSDAELNDAFPRGRTELSLPYLRCGVAWMQPLGDLDVTVAADLDVLPEGRDAFVLNVGTFSVHPRAGLEVSYMDILSIRAGVAEVATTFEGDLTFSPTLGTGFVIGRLGFDYGFGNFAGNASILGNTHRISLTIKP